MAKFEYKGGKFTTTPNHICNDTELSFKAKGLWTYMASKPEGWNFSKDRIKQEGKDGRSSVMTGLQELEDAGYLKRVKYQNKQGLFKHKYILYDFRTTVQQTPDEQTPDNRTTNKERYSNKEKVINYYYSKNNPKSTKYKDFDKFKCEDGTIAMVRWNKWTDIDNPKVQIDLNHYKELPKLE